MVVDQKFQSELEAYIPNYREILSSREVRILWELYNTKENALTEKEKIVFQNLWDNEMVIIRKSLYLDEEEKIKKI